MPRATAIPYNDPSNVAPNTDADERITNWNKANEMVCEVFEQHVHSLPPFGVRMRIQLQLARWLMGERTPAARREPDDGTD